MSDPLIALDLFRLRHGFFSGAARGELGWIGKLRFGEASGHVQFF